MRKTVFGVSLFLGGLFGILKVIELQVNTTYSGDVIHEDYKNLSSFLSTFNLNLLFGILIIMMLAGLIISTLEVFKKES